MRLSWNEMRARAANFVRDWAGEGYEKGQTQLFSLDFFDIFGVPVRPWRLLKSPCAISAPARLHRSFWKGVLLVEQKSKGLNLKKGKSTGAPLFSGAERRRAATIYDAQRFSVL